MADIIWMHDGALRADHPMFKENPDSKAIFIWDDAYFKSAEIGFKQQVFIYEALTHLPVEIIKGDTLSILKEMAGADGQIITAATSAVELNRMMAMLNQTHTVRAVADEVFAHLKSSPDLRRFFRYWNKAKSSAMDYNGGTPDLFGG
jgi:hypothetical protein